MQLPLGIGLRDDATFDAFYPGVNEQALSSLRHLVKPGVQGELFIYLYGETGVGLTHLLQAACQEASVQKQRCMYLSLKEAKQPEQLEGLEQVFLLCLDDIQTGAGDAAFEEAMFHCFNRCQAQGTRLLMAANRLPNELGLGLPDLKSRLNSGLTYQIRPLDEEGKVNALRRRAQARGLELPEAVGQFLIKRMNRNMSELYKLLETLDKASMSQKRPLTVPFVKKVLEL